MKYIAVMIIMGFGYYTWTYGMSLWNNKNKLGGIGVGSLAAIGTIVPIFFLFTR